MAFVNPIPAIPVVPADPNLDLPLSFGPAQPLLLFPVRLETRFFPRGDGGADLRVRVYPDAIHVDTHEPDLTEAEITWGRHFWEQTWRAGDEQAAARRAWHQLVERFDRPRAAWIARALTPLNLEDRPARPMPDGEPLPPNAIRFARLSAKAQAWTRAPHTRMLPSRWWVMGYVGGRLLVTAAGNPIPDRLATGPDPTITADDADDETLPVDEGMKWMTDYAEAERIGMGIRLRLDREQAQGFDFLLVFGTKAAADLPDRTGELASLLDAHHYTSGLGFVLQGTPSNNTEDGPAGFETADRDGERSYRDERVDPEIEVGDMSNADVLARALGLRGDHAAALAHLANGQAKEQLDARHMNRGLWPATWGYFLDQLIGPPLSDADIAWARDHFVEHVRASGPLPAIRVGRQPYGILPATSLRLWKSSAANEGDRTREVALKDFLLRLREFWYLHLGRVPRVGRTGDDPDRDFAEIFSMDGLSSSYAIRHVMGETYLRQLWLFLLPPGGSTPRNQEFWWKKQAELTRFRLDAVGVNWDPRLAHATYSGWSRVLRGPLVQPQAGAGDALLDPNYIELLLGTRDLATLRHESFASVQPRGLLYSLLRHALLLGYWMAAAQLKSLRSDGRLPKLPFEFEVVEPGALSAWRLLDEPVAGISDQPLWTFLRALESLPADVDIASRVAPLLELRESLAHLKAVSAARLQRLCAGTLDLCSHRLDAWATSFATRRLDELRTRRPTGIVLGGYGWVVNLKPAEPPVAATVPGEHGVVFHAADNPGYTHTPSLAQAATAAVLRSGHLTHATTETADLLAVDLSSARVRLAAWLLDGVRQGQPLGALLGYRFERRLQNMKLARFIACFRQIAPLVANKVADTSVGADQPVEALAANSVVDGLVLQRKWKAAGSVHALLSDAPNKPDPAQLSEWGHTLEHELMALDDAVDAVSDALLAESVHQAVQGNATRTASTLDAIAAGDAPPPELDVVRTPRTGTALTHRLVTLLDGAAALPPAWASPVVPYRADAEPRLNAWAATLLPDPTKVRCVIECVDRDGAVADTRDIRLGDLRLAPLDVIYASTAGRSAPSELELRLVNAAAPRFSGMPAGSTLRVAPARGGPSDEVSYGEFAELVRTAHALITGTRGIDGSEVNLPEANQPAGVDSAELEGRADRAAAALRSVSADMKAWLASAADASLGTIRALLERCAHFGVAGAMPMSVGGDSGADRDALSAQADAIARQVSARVARLDALEKSASPGSAEEDARRHHTARLQATFGESFVVLPLFTPVNAVEIERALNRSRDLQDGDPLAAVTWFTRASRVREGVERFEATIRYADALRTGERLNLRVVQLPFQDNDRWVGLPLAGDQPLSSSRFSLVIQSAQSLDVTRPLAGLLIDEWVEVVPNASETTAMVFQFDRPDAAPPQSLLLAVPPDPEAGWTLHNLQQVLLETLDLARLRLVDPPALDLIGHYLPAAYFAVNAARETVSTDFASLA
jgi:hypothetical protein